MRFRARRLRIHAVSLLTPIAGDLRITEGMAGHGIAISGAFAVLTGLSSSALAGTMDRKKLLLVLTVLMGISGALAPNYLTYMAGRALIGVVIGVLGPCRLPWQSAWCPPASCPRPW